jgi:hypothetical protein
MDIPSRFLKDVINPWLLGADPEWAVMTPPDVVVTNTGPNAVNTTKAAGAIGSDHAGRVWELRPSPSPSAYVVATNLWKLLRQQELDKLQGFKWKSGALGANKYVVPTNQPTTLQGWTQYYSQAMFGYSAAQIQNLAQQHMMHQQAAQNPNNLDTLGGHVHYGISQLNAAQRKALNDVTTGLLSLDILPHKENQRRLAITANSSPHYGHLNDPDAVRDCQGHVEYRCAPSWLDRPGQALAALTTYKLAGARPSSVDWPESYHLKSRYLEWLGELGDGQDVDAWILSQFIERNGFESIQADPSSDFKERWRRDNPWER